MSFKNDIEELRRIYKSIKIKLDKLEQDGKIIYPPKQDRLNALNFKSLNEIKIVIMGQDCYHGPNQAHGLAFSVKKDITIPPSLQNIFKELKKDLNCVIPKHGNLDYWASQGVLLLNRSLTVEKGKPRSHIKIGWEEFTNKLIMILNTYCNNLVFMLWGNDAKQISNLIDPDKHLILNAAHPSPLSAYNGFFGCKHFSQANQYLISINKEPIDWQIK